MTLILCVRGLSSSRGTLSIDLDIHAGECVAIIGASGSGKSVMLRLIADLDPGQGSVVLLERSRESWPAPAWRSQVLYQAAEAAWWASTAQEHLKAEALPSAKAMMVRLGLIEAALTQDLRTPSTGERQRLSLVRTLVMNPKVAMLDEPTASLDGGSTLAAEALIREQMDAGLALLLVTHSREQAARLGNRTLQLKDGLLEPISLT